MRVRSTPTSAMWLRLIVASAVLLDRMNALLYVQRNEFRAYDQLDGLWTFVMEPLNANDIGIEQAWFEKDLASFKNATVMPVPSAYNDLFAEAAQRDHIGWVWYQQKYVSPASDSNYRLFLRFSSVNYFCRVFINSQEIGSHEGGHLPFEFEVTDVLKRDGTENRITVAVNNTLSWYTIPPGFLHYKQPIRADGVRQYPDGFFTFTPNFDFFNYAGILRPVYIDKRPRRFIEDITVDATHRGIFGYEVKVNTDEASQSAEDSELFVKLFDSSGQEVLSVQGAKLKGRRVSNIKPWWPRGMGEPNLYTMQIDVADVGGGTMDSYRLPVGFRTVAWDKSKLTINGAPFYCLGFGMHEDADIRGRGYDAVVMTKDLNLVEWTGANCYRTSHYPYSEERQQEADRRGIVVITETPAVGITWFADEVLQLHLKQLEEMISRDKNHPSTVMWSLANEPDTKAGSAAAYFATLAARAHQLDPTRPVTVVIGQYEEKADKVAPVLDVIGVNRYFGWYQDMGYLDAVNTSIIANIRSWHNTFQKPIFVMEYGGDAIQGLSALPSVDFTEQYQLELLEKYHEGFDVLRKEGALAGEMIWNFADFMTAMSTTRAMGNHKGIFTRARQPKAAAFSVRKRYTSLLQQQPPRDSETRTRLKRGGVTAPGGNKPPGKKGKRGGNKKLGK